nr:hypothetical protein [Tanacetum cinerariifolium]
MAIDGVGWDWSYMANKGEDHALVANTEAPTEFTLMANTESKVFDNSLYLNDCKKNNDSLNSMIIDLTDKELEELKLEKDGLDGKLAGFLKASKNLDNLIESQRSDKVKEGVGYNVVPPPVADLYLSPKKDLSASHRPHGATMRPPHRSVGHKPHRASMKPSHRPAGHEPHGPLMNPIRPNTNGIILLLIENFLLVEEIFPLSIGNFPVNRKFPTASRKFTTRSTKIHTADLRKKGKVVKSSACWTWNPSQKLSNKGPINKSVLVMFNKYTYIDTQGRLKHMTGNISYLFDFEPFDRGYVSFGQGGCKITGKGTIKSDSECIVLGRNFKLLDDANILLRTPRQQNMYSIDLNNIVPHKDLTCLVAKASADECILWHRRLGHLNVKTMNKLVRHNLVRGVPTKSFDTDHTCTACLKGKQHKASYMSKLVNSVNKPLHTLHMDLFGPTSVSSISHKWYCLVVTDDFSRFTWTFFLRTKDETSDILKKFITEIENLKDLKVKIIRYDNRGEFRNKEMNDFYSQKGIKREFSNARTPQQNGVAKRRNRTLIEVASTMLADAKLPVTFWAKAVNTACYVQKRVLVNKSQNKTPYELFNGKTPAIGFLKPFGCHVMILNTLDNLGKFEPKGDEGYFIGYSMSSKAFMVFNKRNKRVEENLHVEFFENKAIEKGTKDAVNQEVKKDVSSLRYISLPNWAHDALLESSSSKPHDESSTKVPEGSGNPNSTTSSSNPPADQMETLTVESLIPTVSSPVPTACLNDSPKPFSEARLISKRVANQEESPSLYNNLSLTNRFEDILGVTTSSDEAIRVEADESNMETTISASPTPTLRIHKDHPKS